jgi:hypothetical protein
MCIFFEKRVSVAGGRHASDLLLALNRRRVGIADNATLQDGELADRLMQIGNPSSLIVARSIPVRGLRCILHLQALPSSRSGRVVRCCLRYGQLPADLLQRHTRAKYH